MRALIMVLPLLVLAQVPDQPLAPWGLNQHPTDVPKRHVERDCRRPARLYSPPRRHHGRAPTVVRRSASA